MELYFRSLYQRTMREAYAAAYRAIGDVIAAGGTVLDCGAGAGASFDALASRSGLATDHYRGLEWDAAQVADGRRRGLDILQGDLNRVLPWDSGTFDGVYGLSTLEHLLNPCRFLGEAVRVLKPGGRLVLLTPNISTYFTAVQILLGRMPSSGPHPDSDGLLRSQQMFRVRGEGHEHDTEGDMPVHRHLVVFSYRVLRQYLGMLGLKNVAGRGFGWYPLPNFLQPALERLDPWHCHQMVFTATK
jgi:SAM-dependent methyltransferase